MKIFISCSSSEEISDEYKVVAKYLIKEISKDNDLVFGCANRGLMGISYNEFLNNNRKIYGVCNTKYKDDLNGLKLEDIKYVDSFEEANIMFGKISDLILILPGSFGTISEIIDLLEEKRTGIHDKEMIIFNINGFYDSLIDMLHTVNKKVSNKYDFDKLCKVFNTSDEIIEYINKKNC